MLYYINIPVQFVVTLQTQRPICLLTLDCHVANSLLICSNFKCSEILSLIGAEKEYSTVCAVHDVMHLHTESAQCSMNPFFS